MNADRAALAELVELLRQSDLIGHEDEVEELIARALAGAALRGRVQNALALIYDHTRHEGFTPADDLERHQRVIAEIQTALDLSRPRL